MLFVVHGGGAEGMESGGEVAWDAMIWFSKDPGGRGGGEKGERLILDER